MRVFQYRKAAKSNVTYKAVSLFYPDVINKNGGDSVVISGRSDCESKLGQIIKITMDTKRIRIIILPLGGIAYVQAIYILKS